MTARPIEPFRAAVLRLGAEGPFPSKPVLEGDQCEAYRKSFAGVPGQIAACHGPYKGSLTGWAYRVQLTFPKREGYRADLRAEARQFVEQVREAVQAEVPEAHVVSY